MKNLQLAAILTRSEFLSACMLIILMDSQTKKGQTGKGQTTISGPRLGSDHLNVTPHTQWKQEREQLVKRRSSSVEVMMVYAASESPVIPGVNLRGWDHTRSEGKCCHLVPLEKYFFKKKVLVVCFTCRGVTAASSVLRTSSCPFVVWTCYCSAWHIKDYLVKA